MTMVETTEEYISLWCQAVEAPESLASNAIPSFPGKEWMPLGPEEKVMTAGGRPWKRRVLAKPAVTEPYWSQTPP